MPLRQSRPLPIRRAFVMQLHAEADVTKGRFTGRVEHVLSGKATRFETLEEFLEFLSHLFPSGNSNEET